MTESAADVKFIVTGRKPFKLHLLLRFGLFNFIKGLCTTDPSLLQRLVASNVNIGKTPLSVHNDFYRQADKSNSHQGHRDYKYLKKFHLCSFLSFTVTKVHKL